MSWSATTARQSDIYSDGGRSEDDRGGVDKPAVPARNLSALQLHLDTAYIFYIVLQMSEIANMADMADRVQGGPISLSDRAYEAVKELIYRSELRPGQWLRQRELASRLEMSPTPVVEAFRRLESEGFVHLMPRWGARVRIWTVDELAEGLELRAALEGLIAGRCATVAHIGRVEELRPLAQRLDQDLAVACDATQPPAIELGLADTDNWCFHRALGRLSGFRVIAQEMERRHLLQMTCRMFVFPCKPCPVSHNDILDAIVERNSQAAEDLMRRHVRHVCHVFPQLRERFGNGPVEFKRSTAPNE